MLDIRKELKNYWVDEDGDKEPAEEMKVLLDTFNQMIRKIGKDQSSLTGAMDEIIDSLENKANDEEEIRQYRLSFKNKEKEVEGLLEATLLISDQFESVYRYSMKNEQEQWKNQMKSQWDKIGLQLQHYGITRIEGEGVTAIASLHKVIETIVQNEIEPFQIIEVLQSGYSYKGEVIRKAEVIISKQEAQNE